MEEVEVMVDMVDKIEMEEMEVMVDMVETIKMELMVEMMETVGMIFPWVRDGRKGFISRSWFHFVA